jgi:hypothetical protein
MSQATIPYISNDQLSKKNQYAIEILEHNVSHLELSKLLKTQVLTPEFCITYILNPEKHGSCAEDTYFGDSDILIYQKHITQEQLMLARKKNRSTYPHKGGQGGASPLENFTHTRSFTSVAKTP